MGKVRLLAVDCWREREEYPDTYKPLEDIVEVSWSQGEPDSIEGFDILVYHGRPKGGLNHSKTVLEAIKQKTPVVFFDNISPISLFRRYNTSRLYWAGSAQGMYGRVKNLIKNGLGNRENI